MGRCKIQVCIVAQEPKPRAYSHKDTVRERRNTSSSPYRVDMSLPWHGGCSVENHNLKSKASARIVHGIGLSDEVESNGNMHPVFFDVSPRCFTCHPLHLYIHPNNIRAHPQSTSGPQVVVAPYSLDSKYEDNHVWGFADQG